MKFSAIIVLLNALSRTAADILRRIDPNAVTKSLHDTCIEILEFDGQVCEPIIPTHIRDNIDMYEVHVADLQKQLENTVTANLSAFPADMQASVTEDIRYHKALLMDRQAR